MQVGALAIRQRSSGILLAVVTMIRNCAPPSRVSRIDDEMAKLRRVKPLSLIMSAGKSVSMIGETYSQPRVSARLFTRLDYCEHSR